MSPPPRGARDVQKLDQLLCGSSFIPVSHPFIEWLIGTVRREYLDRVFFWNALDLVRKLGEFIDYYNYVS